MKKFYAMIAVLVGLTAFSLPGTARAETESGVKIGILTCRQLPGGYNLLIHSVAYVGCEFTSSRGMERYTGESGVGLGLNLEWNPAETILFTVLGSTSDIRMGQHVLAGKYFGAKASASVGVGTGVQVLVGGGNKNISLQPLALEGSTGLGAAAGLSYLSLQPAP
ncbi:MAG: DUF992 domain-containing protein [Magnetococcales bacterium]|nr:DUF992 domain-containing protein [Magnetococcales bacterium]